MGLFSKPKQLDKRQLDYVNNLLPKLLRVSELTDKQLKSGDLKQRFTSVVTQKSKQVEELEKHFKAMPDARDAEIAKATEFFNIDLYKAEPFGMVDVGLVERFGTASTGNRYAAETGGLIGAAIQNTFEEVWKNGGSQLKAVQKAKELLVKLAIEQYPQTNSIFNFDIDFRELGDSGNVFIYVRGTAAKSESRKLEEVLKRLDDDYKATEKKLEAERSELELMRQNHSLFPTDVLQIK